MPLIWVPSGWYRTHDESVVRSSSRAVTVHAVAFAAVHPGSRPILLDIWRVIVYRRVDECEIRSSRKQQAGSGDSAFARASAQPGGTPAASRAAAAGD